MGVDNSVRAGCLIQLAATQTKEQKYTDAEGAARQALNLFERSGAGKLELSFSLGILAEVLEAEGKFAEAIPAIERSWFLETGHKSGDPIEYRDSRFVRRLGLLYLKMKEYDHANR